jgi:hypothetical protein
LLKLFSKNETPVSFQHPTGTAFESDELTSFARAPMVVFAM